MRKSRQQILKRGVIAVAVAVVAIQVLPSLADQLSSTPTNDALTSPTPTPVASESASPSPTSSPSSATGQDQPSPEITYSANDTSTAKILDVKNFVVKVPAALRVDPRATTASFNSIALGGSDFALMCMHSTSATFTLGNTSNLEVEGNGSSDLTIAGASSDVLQAITSGHGITVRAPKGIANSAFTVSAGALSKVGLPEGICEKAPISRQVLVAPFGIDLNTVKTRVNLAKK